MTTKKTHKHPAKDPKHKQHTPVGRKPPTHKKLIAKADKKPSAHDAFDISDEEINELEHEDREVLRADAVKTNELEEDHGVHVPYNFSECPAHTGHPRHVVPSSTSAGV